MRFWLPLFDSCAAPARARIMENPRLSPVLGKLEDLLENILMSSPRLIS